MYPLWRDADEKTQINRSVVLDQKDHAAGVPATKEQQDKRYGEREDYQEYTANTPVLVPLPWRKVVPGQRRPAEPLAGESDQSV
jgi:hypothetical protein